METEHRIIDPRPLHNICGICPLAGRYPLKWVGYEVVGEKPQVAFLCESPGYTEMDLDRPLVGDSGQLLREFLEPYLSSYLFMNVLMCHPTNISGFHKPEFDEIQHCLPHVQSILQDFNIRLVVALGHTSAMALVPGVDKKTTVGSLIKKGAQIINGRYVVVDQHPSYIVRNGGRGTMRYTQWSNRLRRLIQPYIAVENPIMKQIREQDHKLKYTIHEPDDLEDILNMLRTVKHPIGFDFEALMIDTWHIDNKPTGFAFAYPTGPRVGRAFFINLRKRSLNEKEIVFLLNYLRERPPIAYNAKYETNLCWATYGERIPFNDSYALCKVDGQKGGLKDNARLYLQSELLWEDLNGDIKNAFKTIFEEYAELAPLYPDEFGLLKAGKVIDFEEKLITQPKLQKKCAKILDTIKYLEGIITLDEISEGMTWIPFEWGAIPTSVIGTYCCFDAYMTAQIWQLLI